MAPDADEHTVIAQFYRQSSKHVGMDTPCEPLKRLIASPASSS